MSTAAIVTEEWWLPNARSRPTAAETAALRAVPATYRRVVGDVYRLSLPDTLSGSGARTIPQESRRVQTWGGYLCGDAHTVVAVNVSAQRLDGVSRIGSPAEPQTLAMVFAIAADELVTLSIRSWPRDDVGREVERLLGSLEIIRP